MMLHRVVAVCLFALISTPLGAAQRAREIQIRYDLTKEQPTALEVWIDCEQDSGWDHCNTRGNDDATKKRVGPNAFTFQLKASDRISLVLLWKSEVDTRGDISYAVTGTNLDDKDLGALKKMVGAGLAPGQTGAVRALKQEADRKNLQLIQKTEIKPVTDDLVAGGRLSVAFGVKTADPDPKKQTVVETAGPLTFRVEAEDPRITVSTGIAVSDAKAPEVAIVKSNTIVTFEKDGKTQQGYQQSIAIRDNKDHDFKPIQSLIVLANFRLGSRVYASMGFQLNQNLFQEPLVGGTYRHPLGKVGVNFSAAVHFSREQEIVESSGFREGQILDPAVGLTVDDIPTEMRYHPRIAFLVTLDFW